MTVDAPRPTAMSRRERLRYRGFRAVLRMRPVGRPADRRAAGRSPDFLIVGGQRCGTTSLYRYLVAAPAVLFAAPDQGRALVRRGVPPARRPGTARTSRSTVRRRGPRPDRRSGRRRRGLPLLPVPPGVPARIAEHLPDVKAHRHPARPGRPGLVRTTTTSTRRGYETLAVRGRPRRRAGPPGRRRRAPGRRAGPAPLAPAPRLRGPRPLRRAARAAVDPRRPGPTASCCTPRTSSATRRHGDARVHDFLGLPRHATPTDRALEPPVEPRAARSPPAPPGRTQFAASDAGWPSTSRRRRRGPDDDGHDGHSTSSRATTPRRWAATGCLTWSASSASASWTSR